MSFFKMHSTYLTLYGAALWHAASISAQNEFPDDQDIVGCNELQCPSQDGGSTSSNCSIAGASYSGIGLARFNVDGLRDASPSETTFSWVQASNATKNPDSEDENDARILGSAFYLGTPAGLSTEGIRGCAAFFHGAKSELRFPQDNQETAQGTCSDVLESDCIDALRQQIASLDLDEESSDPCGALKDELENNFQTQCGDASDDGKWERLSIQTIFGDSVPGPISGRDNSTTNCWPTMPKSNNLTLVDADFKTADFSLGPVSEFFNGVTPVLTVFFGARLDNTSVHMTCLKTVGPSAEAADNMSNGKGEGDEDSASSNFGSASWTVVVAASGLVFWLM